MPRYSTSNNSAASDTLVLSPEVRVANLLLAHTAQRARNVVEAEWSEFDLDADVPTWTIPRAKMKVKRRRPFDHRVVLDATIVEELKRWRRVTGRTSGYVFVSPYPTRRAHGLPLRVEALCRLYADTLKLKDTHSPHGWRSSFSTLVREAEGQHFDPVAVDLCLDHEGRDAVARAYDRGRRLTERIRIASWWDAQLNPKEESDATVIPISRGA